MPSSKTLYPTDLGLSEIMQFLEANQNEANRAGMARFGISASKCFGVSNELLNGMLKPYKKNHELAGLLWHSGFYECRIIAAKIGNPKLVTEDEMEEWLPLIENWADCDTVCAKLWCLTPFAYKKAFEWAQRENELQKRAGIVLIATMGVHDKKASDELMLSFLPLLVQEANYPRNLVKKAVNWALRQIGKRNANLLEPAITCAEEIKALGTSPAKWIAADALREFKKVAENPSRGKGKGEELIRVGLNF